MLWFIKTIIINQDFFPGFNVIDSNKAVYLDAMSKIRIMHLSSWCDIWCYGVINKPTNFQTIKSFRAYTFFIINMYAEFYKISGNIFRFHFSYFMFMG